MKNIYIDKRDNPYIRLYRGIIQQAFVDFDLICQYKKRGIMTFKDYGKIQNVNTEYHNILQFFDDIKDSALIDIDINTVVKMIQNKNGL